MDTTMIIAIWLLLGLIACILFLVSEMRIEAPREIRLSTITKLIALTICGPLGIALYAYVWGDDIVLWKQKKDR